MGILGLVGDGEKETEKGQYFLKRAKPGKRLVGEGNGGENVFWVREEEPPSLRRGLTSAPPSPPQSSPADVSHPSLLLIALSTSPAPAGPHPHVRSPSFHIPQPQFWSCTCSPQPCWDTHNDGSPSPHCIFKTDENSLSVLILLIPHAVKETHQT